MELKSTSSPPPRSPLMRLKRLARPAAPTAHRCELCGAMIAEAHPHLLEIESRQLRCACDACAILFSDQQGQRYRRVAPLLKRLPELQSIDGLCGRLHLPINLAFFYHSSSAGRVLALYPSPAGAIESLLPMDAWNELLAEAPPLAEMQSDVEALLINQIGARRDCFLVSIDQCYALVGLIRSRWRGLSGGKDVADAIAGFFDGLHRRADRAAPRQAQSMREAAHA